MQILIQSGCDIHQKDNRGYAAIHVAICHKHHDTAKLLLGYDPKLAGAVTYGNQTPLNFAISNNDRDMMKYLLRHDEVAVATVSFSGETSLPKFFLRGRGDKNEKKIVL